MKTQWLKDVGLYVRAVFRHWWFLVVDGLLALTDVTERIRGIWWLPPRWVKIGIGLAALLIAQYLAYRDLLLQSRVESKKRARLSIYPEGRSNLYVETWPGSVNALGFYLELGIGIQNNGERNSVIRKFYVEIPEMGRGMELMPSPRTRIQTRKSQKTLQAKLIVTQGNSIVVGAHNICSGILPFYVSGDPGKLPETVLCTLKVEDTEGTSAELTFIVPVVD